MRHETASASLIGRKVCGTWLRIAAVLSVVVVQLTAFSNDQVSVSQQHSRGVCIGMRPNGIVQVEGVLRSESEARGILLAIRSVRPDLRVSVEKLMIDPSAPAVPVLNQIPDFIEELSLTTHEWDLCVKPSEFLVSGQTDSLVTHATFEAMLNIVRFESDSLKTRNLICLVATADLPEVPRNLPNALTEHEEFFKNMPTAERMANSLVAATAQSNPADISFAGSLATPPSLMSRLLNLELAGLGKKITNSADAGLLVPDRLNWLFLEADRALHTPPPLIATIIATPLSDEGAEAQEDSTPVFVASLVQVEPAEPARPPLSKRFLMRAKPKNKRNLKVLGRVPFGSQSFMLQTTQMTAVDKFAGELLTDLRINDDVILLARVGGTGTDAFNEWVSNKRVEEVKRSLLSSGIAKERISVELKAARSDDENLNTVEIRVPIQAEATASIFRKPTVAGTEIPETPNAPTTSEITTPVITDQSPVVAPASIFKAPENLPTIDAPISTPIAVPVPETGVVLRVE